jgi:hypothetical protein
MLRDYPTVQWRAGLEISRQLKPPTSKTLRAPCGSAESQSTASGYEPCQSRLRFSSKAKVCNFEQFALIRPMYYPTCSTERSWVNVD